MIPTRFPLPSASRPRYRLIINTTSDCTSPSLVGEGGRHESSCFISYLDIFRRRKDTDEIIPADVSRNHLDCSSTTIILQSAALSVTRHELCIRLIPRNLLPPVPSLSSLSTISKGRSLPRDTSWLPLYNPFPHKPARSRCSRHDRIPPPETSSTSPNLTLITDHHRWPVTSTPTRTARAGAIEVRRTLPRWHLTHSRARRAGTLANNHSRRRLTFDKRTEPLQHQ
jgi:hypothetical protein